MTTGLHPVRFALSHTVSALFLRFSLLHALLKLFVVVSLLLIIQVRKAPPSAPGTALHRSEVPGAPVLLQTDWGHAHRHLPDGNAGGASSAHLEEPAALWVRMHGRITDTSPGVGLLALPVGPHLTVARAGLNIPAVHSNTQTCSLSPANYRHQRRSSLSYMTRHATHPVHR